MAVRLGEADLVHRNKTLEGWCNLNEAVNHPVLPYSDKLVHNTPFYTKDTTKLTSKNVPLR